MKRRVKGIEAGSLGCLTLIKCKNEVLKNYKSTLLVHIEKEKSLANQRFARDL